MMLNRRALLRLVLAVFVRPVPQLPASRITITPVRGPIGADEVGCRFIRYRTHAVAVNLRTLREDGDT